MDGRAYTALLAEGCAGAGVSVWGYCLMPNHVHLILVPRDERGCAPRWAKRIDAIPGA